MIFFFNDAVLGINFPQTWKVLFHHKTTFMFFLYIYLEISIILAYGIVKDQLPQFFKVLPEISTEHNTNRALSNHNHLVSYTMHYV